jgi:RimJ/RimL family protein N-acetyltransferase
MSTVLETDRLVLRHSIPEDADAVAALWADPEVMHYMGGPRPAERTRKLVREARPEPIGLWTTIERETGAFVGDCGLIEKEVDGRTDVELTCVLDKAFWRRGLATEAARALCVYAFETLRCNRVIALVDLENVASARVAQKAGLDYERTTVRPSGKVMAVYGAYTG